MFPIKINWTFCSDWSIHSKVIQHIIDPRQTQKMDIYTDESTLIPICVLVSFLHLNFYFLLSLHLLTLFYSVKIIFWSYTSVPLLPLPTFSTQLNIFTFSESNFIAGSILFYCGRLRKITVYSMQQYPACLRIQTETLEKIILNYSDRTLVAFMGLPIFMDLSQSQQEVFNIQSLQCERKCV